MAAKYMPVSHLIIGVDLDPIKAIPGVKTFVCDITTEKCRSELRKELKTWKVDVFLNDGAPNVGAAWSRDAYNQAELCLMACKLATEFLIEGGTFVSKVFRSKDYNSLMWVFKQLFSTVEATKPTSSRSVSAEIFVVCSGFLAPKKIDPRLFDPKTALQEVEPTAAKSINIFKPEKKVRSRDGYEEGAMLLFKTMTLAEFVASADPMTVLATVNCLTMADAESVKCAAVSSGGDDISHLIADLKLLGKADFKALLKWRLKVRKTLGVDTCAAPEESTEAGADKRPLEDTEQDIDEVVFNLEKSKKRLKKKRLERKNKERLRLQMGMSVKGDTVDFNESEDIFRIPKILQTNENISLSDDDVANDETGSLFEDSSSDSEDSSEDDDAHFMAVEKVLEESYESLQSKRAKAAKAAAAAANDGSAEDGASSQSDASVASEDEAGNAEDAWFSRPEFQTSHKEDFALDRKKLSLKKKKKGASTADSDDDEKSAKITDLNSASMITTAMRLKREDPDDLVDDSFNRYALTEDETSLPKWYLDDERKHNIPQKPITKEAVELLKQKMKSITGKPIKKELEYKMRKRARLSKKLESIKTKAASIADTEEMSESQKFRSINKILNKNLKEKKKERKLVVAAGSNRGIKGRPKGVRGKYKMVDSRMKKELRAKTRKAKDAKNKR